jgi:tRNA A-37 threonylcarbamoyl transferase component Bud32
MRDLSLHRLRARIPSGSVNSLIDDAHGIVPDFQAMIGSLIGNYKLLEKVGEGGEGEVFRAEDLLLEREVTIKALHPELAHSPPVVERFQSEARTLAKLNHPNIATLYALVREGDRLFMVMEFVRGERLDELVRLRGVLNYSGALPLFRQVLAGMSYAHRQGVIHCDIKSSNLMLSHSGIVKVMDFGVARVLRVGATEITRTGSIVGTPAYMSPEQIRGQALDARSDVYSLGIVLYEMLTGRVPFEVDNEFDLMRAQVEQAPMRPGELVSDLPPQVEDAVMRALEKVPAARFQTADDFLSALDHSAGGIERRQTPDVGLGLLFHEGADRAYEIMPIGTAGTALADPQGGNRGTRVAGTTGMQVGFAQPRAAEADEPVSAGRVQGKGRWPRYTLLALLLAVVCAETVMVLAKRWEPATPTSVHRGLQPAGAVGQSGVVVPKQPPQSSASAVLDTGVADSGFEPADDSAGPLPETVLPGPDVTMGGKPAAVAPVANPAETVAETPIAEKDTRTPRSRKSRRSQHSSEDYHTRQGASGWILRR